MGYLVQNKPALQLFLGLRCGKAIDFYQNDIECLSWNFRSLILRRPTCLLCRNDEKNIPSKYPLNLNLKDFMKALSVPQDHCGSYNDFMRSTHGLTVCSRSGTTGAWASCCFWRLRVKRNNLPTSKSILNFFFEKNLISSHFTDIDFG